MMYISFLSLHLTADTPENAKKRMNLGYFMIALIFVIILRCLVELVVSLVNTVKYIKKFCRKNARVAPQQTVGKFFTTTEVKQDQPEVNSDDDKHMQLGIQENQDNESCQNLAGQEQNEQAIQAVPNQDVIDEEIDFMAGQQAQPLRNSVVSTVRHHQIRNRNLKYSFRKKDSKIDQQKLQSDEFLN